jgi:hypothetical protein
VRACRGDASEVLEAGEHALNNIEPPAGGIPLNVNRTWLVDIRLQALSSAQKILLPWGSRTLCTNTSD